MKHALIVGERGVGKSTLLRRVLTAIDCPVAGFETKKEPDLTSDSRGTPIYIHPYGAERCYSPENLVGWCGAHNAASCRGAFDRFAPQLLSPVCAGSVLCFDEIGFLESQETQFCNAIRERLNGSIPVVAAVKSLYTPFLDEIRHHPNCRCFEITAENRDALFYDVLDFLRANCGDGSI